MCLPSRLSRCCFSIRASAMLGLLELQCKPLCAILGESTNSCRNEDEGPRAYIQTFPKTSVSAEEIHQLISEKLPPYKRLSGGISFIEKIPRNAVRPTDPLSLSSLPRVS